jgi:hypothetical protein
MPLHLRLRGSLLALILVLGVLPLRPLASELFVTEPGRQHCALHGADCECKQHCKREQPHAHDSEPPATAVAHKADAPQTSSCHRASPSQTEEGAATQASSGTESSAQVGAIQTPGGCVMTSCGSEGPMLLAAQGQLYLAALLVSAPHRQPGFDPAPITRTLFHSSLAVPPPAPPPKS